MDARDSGREKLRMHVIVQPSEAGRPLPKRSAFSTAYLAVFYLEICISRLDMFERIDMVGKNSIVCCFSTGPSYQVRRSAHLRISLPVMDFVVNR